MQQTGATRATFGHLPDGTAVEAVTLRNAVGTTARILAWGAALQSLSVRDRQGRFDDVVLGYDTLEAYLAKPQFFGATVGRYANRIAGGRFTLDGVAHAVPATDGPNALHGGTRGFDKRLWSVAEIGSGEGVSRAVFRRTSPDGEEGFPGTLDVAVTYALDDADRLAISFEATTDRPTVVNLTNHTYFHLGGASCGRTALGHEVAIAADAFTPVDTTLIPTGELRPVEGTVFDFRAPMAVEARLRDGREAQLVLARGYDHNFVLRGGVAGTPREAVRLADPVTGRVLSIATTEPGVQFYSGNFLDATSVGKGGLIYRQGDGLAFETQHFPDSPNHPHFPSTRLDPGQVHRSTTAWHFTTSGTE